MSFLYNSLFAIGTITWDTLEVDIEEKNLVDMVQRFIVFFFYPFLSCNKNNYVYVDWFLRITCGVIKRV